LYKRSFPTTLIGLQLNVPIFSGFQRSNKIKQAEFTVRKSQNDLFQAKNSINFDIKNSITQYTNSLTSLENQQRNLDLANEVLRVSKIKYEQGVGSSLEVTQAQTSLKESQNNYINALYDALISKVDTERATGLIK
ncbi:MAG: TolC family protein, partial [Bacteroidetes bacterium]|nr:TolC family protein [Bacteroidota bacterium]